MAYSVPMAFNVSGNLQLNNYAELIEAANRMERGAPEFASTNDTERAEKFSAQDEALINDITDMIDELQSNMSAGAGNELESMMSRIAGRLMISGLTSAAANAIMLEVERRDAEDGKGFSAEQWNRIKEDVEKERKEQAKMADFADDAQNASQINQNDYSRTYSEDELDNMQWQGDQNATWTIGGRTMSRKKLYDAAKDARRALNENPPAGWSAEKLARENELLSGYQQAIKNNDLERAQYYRSQFAPETELEVSEQEGFRADNNAPSPEQSNVDQGQTAVRSDAVSSRADMREEFGSKSDTEQVSRASVASSVDGGIPVTTNLSGNFNTQANPTVGEPVRVAVAEPARSLPSMAMLDQSL